MNKKPKKPWYSENCYASEKTIYIGTRIAKLLQNDPKNPQWANTSWLEIKNSYKHMIKVSKQQ